MEFFPHNPFVLSLFYDKIPSKLRRTIVKAYQEPYRKYHNQTHLVKLWSLYLAMFKHDAATQEKFFFTTIFHDLVYVPGSNDNEENSAKIWLEFSKEIFSEKIRKEINAVILATKDHTNPDHDSLPEWGKIFLDLDLYELASYPEIYKANGELIRQEFAPFVTSEQFKEGRIKFLESMTKAPKIFRIFDVRNNYARVNMGSELNKLMS